jgi:signal transduction histidine kinase
MMAYRELLVDSAFSMYTRERQAAKLPILKEDWYLWDLFQFDELVEEVVSALQFTAGPQMICREGASGQTVWGDRMRIGQVIANLLSNAIKYAAMTERILVRTTVAGGIITFCVQDFGPGIPKELQED